MEKNKLIEITEQDFNSFIGLIEEAFPSIERRSNNGQKAVFKDELYKVIGYKNDENKVIGFIAFWQFENFNYIEHFAVDNSMRNHGIGSRLLKEFLKLYDKKTVLEVELPENDMAKRRIEFYKRSKMKINDYEYLQPPYESGNELFPLQIMSYPDNLSKDEFEEVRNQIYTKVYKADLSIISNMRK